jgi:hypothetical protein
MCRCPGRSNVTAMKKGTETANRNKRPAVSRRLSGSEDRRYADEPESFGRAPEGREAGAAIPTSLGVDGTCRAPAAIPTNS